MAMIADEGRTYRYMRAAGGTAGDPPAYTYPQPGDNYTIGTDPCVTWGRTYTTPAILYDLPDTKEAITILEEAEYELKELLKKAGPIAYYNLDGTVERVDKNNQALVETALRDVQKALRALLKVG